MKILSFLLPVVALFCLNSCVSNITGGVMSHFEYKACVNAKDVMITGNLILKDSKYYMVLPQYRAEGEPSDFYDVFGLVTKRKPAMRPTGREEMVQIPDDYAAYLLGKASGPKVPSSLTRITTVDDAFRAGCEIVPVVNKPDDYRYVFAYKNESLTAWNKTTKVGGSLCLDFFISIFSTAIYIPTLPLLCLVNEEDELTPEEEAEIEEMVRRKWGN